MKMCGVKSAQTRMTASYRLTNRHGYSVRFAPFEPNLLAVASSQLFGVMGAGSLILLETVDGTLLRRRSSEWPDGLFDVTWCRSNQRNLVTSSGDGSLQIWDTHAKHEPNLRLVLHGHKKEVYAVDWERAGVHERVVSGSWDSTVKLWDPEIGSLLNTFIGHASSVYGVCWSPFMSNCFASVATDGSLKIWNSSASNHSVCSRTIATDGHEALSCDWNHFDQHQIATSTSDGLVTIWDVRNMSEPTFERKSSDYAVRKVRFSPHNPATLAMSCFDFSTKVLDTKTGALNVVNRHAEFVYGLDWNPNVPGQLSDCGWDSFVNIYDSRTIDA